MLSPLARFNRNKKGYRTCLFLLLMVPAFVEAQQSFPVSELSVDGIYAARTGDPNLYCLLGANTCLLWRLHNPWTHDTLIEDWLAAHPKATATPISTHNMVTGGNHRTASRVYLWIEDSGVSLNVALVREGHYIAAAMKDMVEADREMAEMDNNPAPAKERAETPEENRPHRLVSDADYSQKIQRIALAEIDAKQEKKGMWSEAGMKGRSPPRDNYLVRQYEEHHEWFERIRSLIHDDERLTAINRDPKSRTSARSTGVPQTTIDEYLDLLKKLDANEQLVGVAGLGETCLIMADITYGLFDNGVIKGYVLSPADPTPVVDDLDEWKAESDATTAFRHVGDDWYLFELVH
jgi:hypothetical protein